MKPLLRAREHWEFTPKFNWNALTCGLQPPQLFFVHNCVHIIIVGVHIVGHLGSWKHAKFQFYTSGCHLIRISAPEARFFLCVCCSCSGRGLHITNQLFSWLKCSWFFLAKAQYHHFVDWAFWLSCMRQLRSHKAIWMLTHTNKWKKCGSPQSWTWTCTKISCVGSKNWKITTQ